MYPTKSVLDLRIYTIRPRKMNAFIEAFDRLGMPVQLRHLGPPIGMYVNAVGDINEVVHIWQFDSMADFEKRAAARNADPDWPAYLAATVDMIDKQQTRLIRRANTPMLDGLVAGLKA
jgi:hypothetical protein